MSIAYVVYYRLWDLCFVRSSLPISIPHAETSLHYTMKRHLFLASLLATHLFLALQLASRSHCALAERETTMHLLI